MASKKDPPYTALRALKTTERLRTALRDKVCLAPISQRRIEKNHGWTRGYLSQVLAGHITLTLHHTIAVLDSLDLEPARFFAEALGSSTPWAVSGEIQQKMERYDEAFAELKAKGYLGDGEPSADG